MTDHRLILIRHGRTPANTARQLAGHFDSPLDDVGLRQASLLADRLATIDLEGARLHTSDLSRARDTAAPLAAVLGLTPEAFPALREIGFGEWEGRTEGEATSEQAQALLVGFAKGDPDWRAPGGESPREVAERMATHVRAHVGETPLIVVSHGMAITALLCELTGDDYTTAWTDDRYSHVNTAWSDVRLGDDGTIASMTLMQSEHLDAMGTDAHDPWATTPGQHEAPR